MIINLKTTQKKALLSGHSDIINHISYCYKSSDKPNKHYQIVTASSDRTIKIWDAETGDLLKTLSGHVNCVNYAFFTKDDKRILSADDRKIIMWDAETGDTLFTILTNDDITGLSLGKDNRYFVCVTKGTVTSYSIENGESIGVVSDRYYNSWTYNRSGKGMSITSDGILRFCNGRSYSDYPHIGKLHNSMVHDVSFSPDGNEIISASEDSTIIVWNNRAFCKKKLTGHTGPVTSARFSPNGETIVSSSRDSTIRIWNVKYPYSSNTIKFPSAITSVSYSSDGGYLATAAENGHIYIYNTKTWELIREISTNMKGLYSVVMSLDGKRILSLSIDEQKVGLWDIENGMCIYSIMERNDIRQIAWSPDENYIAIQVVDSILLWNFQSKSIINRWRAPGLNIAFSPNGRWIINSDSSLPSIFLWDAHSGTLIKAFKGHSGFMGGIGFNADGNRIVADYSSPYEENGEGIEVWNIPPIDTIIKQTRKRFEKRKLSVSERKQ